MTDLKLNIKSGHIHLFIHKRIVRQTIRRIEIMINLYSCMDFIFRFPVSPGERGAAEQCVLVCGGEDDGSVQEDAED